MILQLSTGHCRKTRFVTEAVFLKNFTSALESPWVSMPGVHCWHSECLPNPNVLGGGQAGWPPPRGGRHPVSGCARLNGPPCWQGEVVRDPHGVALLWGSPGQAGLALPQCWAQRWPRHSRHRAPRGQQGRRWGRQKSFRRNVFLPFAPGDPASSRFKMYVNLSAGR